MPRTPRLGRLLAALVAAASAAACGQDEPAPQLLGPADLDAAARISERSQRRLTRDCKIGRAPCPFGRSATLPCWRTTTVRPIVLPKTSVDSLLNVEGICTPAPMPGRRWSDAM